MKDIIQEANTITSAGGVSHVDDGPRYYFGNMKSYKKASHIAKYFMSLKNNLNINNKNLSFILKKNIKKLENFYKIKIDYVEFRNEKDLAFAKSRKKYRLFIAYNIDNVRLIDNF